MPVTILPKLYLISRANKRRIAADYLEFGSHQRMDSVKSMKKTLFVLFLLVNVIPLAVSADVLVLPAARDNTLFEDATGRFSDGAGQFLFMGRTGDDNGLDNLKRRALLSFDLTAIPPGSVVESVTLSLTIDRVPPDAAGGTAYIHHVLVDWGEGSSDPFGPEGQGTAAQAGDATWIHTFFDTQTWTVPGGDYSEGASALADFTNGPETIFFPTGVNLVADLQSWVDNPAGNYGWIVIGDEENTMNARRLLSRENSDPGRPELTVEFTPVVVLPEPVTVPIMSPAGYILLVLLILMAASRFRKNQSRP